MVRQERNKETCKKLTLYYNEAHEELVSQNEIPINDTHREKLNSVQEFVKIKSWLLLIFSTWG